MSDEVKVPIRVSTLEEIANVIREKEGSTEKILVADFADRIDAMKVMSGEDKIVGIVDGTITELTAEDLDGATKIKDGIFRDCKNLTSVTIPDSVTSIGNSAFNGCSNLSSVIMSDNVTSIGDNAFDVCRALTSIRLSNNITSINYCAFRGTGLTSIVIPDSVTSIGVEAFSGCGNLSSVTIPDSVTIINSQAFISCPNLSSVTIPDSVTTIGDRAFTNCVSVTIGNGVTKIGESSFSGTKLKDFTIASPIPTSLSFRYAYDLTIDSLKNIINALVDYSGTENEGTYKLTLNINCNSRLDNEGATAPGGLTWKEYIAAKGWTLA